MKRLLAAWLLAGFILTACGSSGGTTPPGDSSPSANCDALFKTLDDFRNAHQQKVIAGVHETDAQLNQYQQERDRLIAAYEAVCGPLS